MDGSGWRKGSRRSESREGALVESRCWSELEVQRGAIRNGSLEEKEKYVSKGNWAAELKR